MNTLQTEPFAYDNPLIITRYFAISVNSLSSDFTVRKQEIALKEKERLLKEQEDRENGILPPEPEVEAVEEQEEVKEEEKPGILFAILNIFKKPEKTSE